MEIELNHRADGTCEVRTSTGILKICDNEHTAVAYATGLVDGYKAAISKLDACHGWRFG